MSEKDANFKESSTAISERKNAGAAASTTKDDLIIVGIGASAGGLDALQRVLPGLPAKAGMAYIIAQHLAPKHRSLLSSLLAKHTNMAVETIKDGMLVRSDTIYITPPNKDVILSKNRLKLSEASSIGPRPSIDYFFTSLAEQKRAHAVGIILSGTGTDGAHGIRAIKSNEGITMAQTIESAKFAGMPQAAISTGLVDLVLPPENIGQEIENALKYPNLIAKVPLDTHPNEIGVILDMLLERTGVDFRDYKQSTIHRRISRRMVIHKMDDLHDYIAYIKKQPDELSVLQKDLLISVTSFFRDAQAFETLERRLRELFKNKMPGDTFRAWVPGCSTGEEAYTMAILVAEILGSNLSKYRIQIFATDLDEDSVQIARKGVYPVATVMETDGRRFEKHFSPKDNTVTIKKAIRDMVILARQDLIKNTPFLHLDLISCRNLMIYFNSELQDKLLSLFHFSLNPEGLLFLGKSESINKRTDLFKTVDNRWKIYQRKEGAAKRLPKLMQSRHMTQLATHRATMKKQTAGGAKRESLLFDALLGLIGSCAVLVDDNTNILYIRGEVDPYFKFPQGAIRDSLNLLDIARPEIRYILQSMLHKSTKNESALTSRKIALGEEDQAVVIKITPLQKGDTANQRLLVFSPAESPKPDPQRSLSPDEIDHERMRELEQELEVTREHLQDTIEELETSSEELQSLNEELQSANEELQASNEELETSNEELQASNEELNTVNDELRAKSEEAAELLEDLKTSENRYRLLIDNMNEAVMLCELDYGPRNQPSDLVIGQANRALEQLFGIQDHDLPLRAGSANLNELVTEQMLSRFVNVANGGDPQRFEVHLPAIEKNVTLSVYHMDEERIGIVCRDDTERKRAEEALKVREARYRELVQNANSAIIRWKIDGTLTFFNEFAQEFFGYRYDEVIGKNVKTLLPETDSLGQGLQKLVEDIVSHPDSFANNINENVCRDGRRVWMTWTNKPIYGADGQLSEILAVGTDITERIKAEQALQKNEKEQIRQRRFLQTLLNHAQTCIAVMKGPELRYTLVNPAYQALRPDMEMVGRTYREVFPGAVESGAEALVQTVLDTGKPRADHQYQVPIPGKPDAAWDCQVVRLPTEEGDEPSALIITWETTESKKVKDALRESNESLEKQVAKRTALIEKRTQQLQALSRELIVAEEQERKRLADLLHDDLQQLLASAKMQLQAACPNLPDTPDLSNIEKILDESIQKARNLSHELNPPVLNHAGLVPALQWLTQKTQEKFGLKVDLDIRTTRQFDHTHLHSFIFRAVQELLFNITKHAGVKSASMMLDDSEDGLILSISDQGKGFDQEAIMDAAIPDGFGLLSLKERAQSIGAELDIDSTLGTGSRIALTIPFELFEARPLPSEPAERHSRFINETVAPDRTDGLCVLFADDHEVMRHGLIGLIANQPGINVVGEAGDGRQALEMALQLRPDVIVMDVSMPNMDGIEATRRIKAEIPGTRIIGLSMHEDEHIIELMRGAGADDFISKAASTAELVEAICKNHNCDEN